MSAKVFAGYKMTDEQIRAVSLLIAAVGYMTLPFNLERADDIIAAAKYFEAYIREAKNE